MTPNHRFGLDRHGVLRRNPRAAKPLAAASHRTPVGRVPSARGQWLLRRPGELPRRRLRQVRSVAISSIRRTREYLRSERADLGRLRRGHSLHEEMRIGSDDSSTRPCAIQVLNPRPRRLRSPSFKSRSTASYVQHEVPAATHQRCSRHWIVAHRDAPRRVEQ